MIIALRPNKCIFQKCLPSMFYSSIPYVKLECTPYSFNLIARNIPETIQSVEEIDRVFFFNICIQCLSLLNQDILNTISFAEDDMDLTHSNCNVLATILRVLSHKMD